ncbi:MAG TPA: substrate-binding domain-containing protein [Bryobacteraceae bacterium]|nr:substrate-binding domain-containing protein [Bryobacteraceae bacterium]
MRLFSFTLLVVSALTGAACSGSRHEASEKYYLVSTNTKLPYWQAASSGLAKAGAQLGVVVETVGPDTYDPQAEKQAFTDALAKKPAGILVSAADPAILKLAIDEAVAQKVPVITMDADAPDSKRALFIGTNNYQVGVIGGKLLARLLGGKGNAVVFTMPGQVNLEQRLQGYKAAAGDGIKFEEVDIKGDPRIAFDTTKEMLGKKDEKVDALICLEASACKEVADVVNRNNTKKVVVAMDTDKETLEWIQKGIIAATIGQKPYTMAFYGLKMLDDLHHYPPPSLDKNFAQDSFAPLPTYVDTGSTLIDKSNVDEFLRQSQAAKGQ